MKVRVGDSHYLDQAFVKRPRRAAHFYGGAAAGEAAGGGLHLAPLVRTRLIPGQPRFEMINKLALIVVLMAGLGFIGLGVVAFVAPDRTSRFLLGFASSALTHFTELALRFVVGAAFLEYGRHMLFPGVFVAFGWILVITTAALGLVPWKLHGRFARWSVPRAVRHLRLVATASFMLGSLIIVAAVGGSGPGLR